ncbi:MAG TPA: DinB family protein [Desulfobulbaceae bacterium]|nr:DinB family protein [Desulfobulbaceae bacterium]
MANPIKDSLAASVAHAFGLMDEFLKLCPEDIWAQRFGGWPIWRQFFHAFNAIDFFLRAENAAETPAPFGANAGNLDGKNSDIPAPGKEAMREYMEAAQKRVDGYLASLNDEALGQLNKGLSARIGREYTHAATIALLASHTMYHLGTCDAALRESGRPGVF